MTKLWISGTVSIALILAITILGGHLTGRPIGVFLVFILILAGLMVLTARGHRWARWIVSPMLLFFAVSTLRARSLLGVVFALAFVVPAVIFFMYRSPD